VEEIKVTHPLELALGGLGQAASLPGAPAPGRPWAPAWTPQAPGACPLTGQEKVLTLSLLEGSLIKVEASPASPDLFIEISRLPTRVQRKGALGASFYDLPGIQSVAMSQGYRIEYAPEVQALIDKWNLWCLDLEQVKTFSDVSGFRVPGLDVEFMPFQARGVAYGCKIKSFMLLDTMGLGKSIQVLGILYTHRLSLGGRLETLILSPTSVVGDWQAKFRKFAKIEVSVATGSKAKRTKVYQGKPEFLLMSYDVFMRDMVEVAKSFRPKALICDECFPYNQFVATKNGSIRIGRLYNLWLAGKAPLIKSLNLDSGSFEYRSILKAWKRELKPMVYVGGSGFGFRCTPGHLILTSMGWVPAGNLRVGDFVTTGADISGRIRYLAPMLNSDQKQVLIGSFLGDGNIHRLGGCRYRIRFLHGAKQRRYLVEKSRIFGCNKIAKIKNNGYSGGIAYRAASQAFFCKDIPKGKKEFIPDWMIEEMDARAIAIWLLDDASFNHKKKQVVIHTNRFPEYLVERLCVRLREFGVNCYCSITAKHDGRFFYYIRIPARGYKRTMELCGKFFFLGMEKKIPMGSEIYEWSPKYPEVSLGLVTTIEQDDKPRIESENFLFDIEIDENHNFVICSPSNKSQSGVVVHNCQRISNRKNKAAIRLFDFVDAARPQYRIMASGSPIANKPMDLWSLLRLVNADLAGSPTLFEKRYAREKLIYHKDKATGEVKPKGTTYGSGDKAKFVPLKKFENLNPKKPADAILLRELRAKISPWLIRRLKKDVLTDLPETTEETISIKLGPRERKVYEELQARFAEAMAGVADEDSENRVDNFFTWFIRAQQVCCSLEIGGHGKESSKIDELRKFVEDYSEEQKILIFSRFKGMTDIVHREMKEYNPAYLHGAVAQADRQPLVDRFQTEDDCRLFISTLGAGGVGLTLTAGSIVARLDRWVSPILNDQCVARADRIGQKRNVLVVDFVVRDSVEERILGILEGKSRMINSLIVSEQSEEQQEKKILRALGKQGMLKLI